MFGPPFCSLYISSYLFSGMLFWLIWKKANRGKWSYDIKDVKRRRQKKTFKPKQYKFKFIFQQYMQWNILKHYYGSITVCEIILRVCVCVCVRVININTAKKDLITKVSYACWLRISTVCFFLWFDEISVFDAGKSLIDKV